MMGLEEKRDFDVSPSLVVGDRQIFVVCERLQIGAWKKHLVFGMLISPTYIVIVEKDLSFAFSLPEGRGADIEDLFLRIPSLKEKLHLTRNQSGSVTSLKTKDISQAELDLEFSNNDESSEF